MEDGQHPFIETGLTNITINNIENKPGVYCIMFVNNTFYVGRSIYIRRRIKQHLNDLKNNKHCNIHMQNVYNKYKVKKFFVKYCIDTIEQEKLLIDKYFEEKLCLNASKQTFGGHTYSKEHPNYENIIRKVSAASSGCNNGMYGRTHSDESIELIKSKKRKYKEEYQWLNLDTGEEVICSVYELQSNWGANNVRHLISNRIHSSNGWVLNDQRTKR